MTNQAYDLTNQRFTRLTAIRRIADLNGRSRWLCLCDCGKEKHVLTQNLVNGHVKSCGCLSSEAKRKRIIAYNVSLDREIHNETKTRLYSIYIGVKTRCCSPSCSAYPEYGAKGIRICDEWLNSYAVFREWALTNGYSDDLTIDRIDPRGHYEPSNCRWASYFVQNTNKSRMKRNTSGHVGVSYNKAVNKYVAYITRNKKHKWLGEFETFEDACTAREKAEAEDLV